MNNLLNGALQAVAGGCTGALLTGVLILFRDGVKKAERAVAGHFSPDDAAKVNSFLDVIERVAETVVQDLNSRIVIGLKQINLFTAETAASVKEGAVVDVLANLGPIKGQVEQLLGPLENIIGQMIEKHVLANKTNIHVQTAS